MLEASGSYPHLVMARFREISRWRGIYLPRRPESDSVQAFGRQRTGRAAVDPLSKSRPIQLCCRDGRHFRGRAGGVARLGRAIGHGRRAARRRRPPLAPRILRICGRAAGLGMRSPCCCESAGRRPLYVSMHQHARGSVLPRCRAHWTLWRSNCSVGANGRHPAERSPCDDRASDEVRSILYPLDAIRRIEVDRNLIEALDLVEEHRGREIRGKTGGRIPHGEEEGFA